MYIIKLSSAVRYFNGFTGFKKGFKTKMESRWSTLDESCMQVVLFTTLDSVKETSKLIEEDHIIIPIGEIK
jgi:hypothetical protein